MGGFWGYPYRTCQTGWTKWQKKLKRGRLESRLSSLGDFILIEWSEKPKTSTGDLNKLVIRKKKRDWKKGGECGGNHFL